MGKATPNPVERPSDYPKHTMNSDPSPTQSASSHGANVIDGRFLAKKVREDLARRVDESAKMVRLDAILVGEDTSASLYAENQKRTCARVGIEYVLHKLSADSDESVICECITGLNSNEMVSAIMMHLPLPDGVDTERLQSVITPDKDVEGVNPANIGNIVYGRRSLVPCTALAAVEMIESTGITLRGSRCVLVGASNIVGKPVAVLLMRSEATVISTNKFTENISELTSQADVLVSAAGVPGLITAEMVKPGAVGIDVGINRIRDESGELRTVGDVLFEEVSQVAAHISPVPGGVGPMTVAMLLRNTVDAAGA